MTTATYQWKLVRRLASDHRIFKDELTGQLAIADNSGTRPDTTEDGVIWIALDQPAHVGVDDDRSSPYVSLSVFGPRIGDVEKGMHVGVFLEDVPFLHSIGMRFELTTEVQKKLDAWLKLQAVLKLQEGA